jgi:hypothetical protein
MAGPIADPHLPNRIAEFIRGYDATIGAIIGAILGATISFLLLWFYDKRRYRPRVHLAQVFGYKRPQRDSRDDSLMGYELAARFDGVNSGGGGVTILRPLLLLLLRNRIVYETKGLKWEETLQRGSSGMSWMDDLAGITLGSQEMVVFTFSTFLSKKKVSSDVWQAIESGEGSWRLVCPLSNGRTCKTPVKFVMPT